MKPSTGVLIIDDDPSLRESIGAYLEDRDFIVQTAADGHTGLSLISQKAPPRRNRTRRASLPASSSFR